MRSQEDKDSIIIDVLKKKAQYAEKKGAVFVY